jgi:hypothetical protein
LQYLEAPGITHWEAFTHVLRYLAGSKSLSLIYDRNSLAPIEGKSLSLIYDRNSSAPIEGYTDADWGNCLMSCHSVTGFLTRFNNHLISWQTKKQPVVSLSSCEAKYRALTDFSCEVLWIRQFANEVKIADISAPTVIHEDNQGFIAVANFEANTNSKRMKHVDIQLHFVREVINNSKIVLLYTPTNEMLADFLTKAIPCPALTSSLCDLGLFRLEGRGGVEV